MWLWGCWMPILFANKQITGFQAPSVQSQATSELVFATVSTHDNGTGLGLGPGPNSCNRFYQSKTRTVAIGPLLPPKTRHFNLTALPPIKYLRSDCILTWSIHTFCIFRRSFTPSFQFCDATNMCGVVIENPWVWSKDSIDFTAIPRIFVGSQIWHREVKEHLKLQKLDIDNAMIRSVLKYWIASKLLAK